MNPQEVGASNFVFLEPVLKQPYFSLKIGTVDYRHLNLLESNALHYVCDYLYGKCLSQHVLCVW